MSWSGGVASWSVELEESVISGWGTGAKDGEGCGEIVGPGSGGRSLACVSESPITSWEGRSGTLKLGRGVIP